MHKSYSNNKTKRKSKNHKERLRRSVKKQKGGVNLKREYLTKLSDTYNECFNELINIFKISMEVKFPQNYEIDTLDDVHIKILSKTEFLTEMKNVNSLIHPNLLIYFKSFSVSYTTRHIFRSVVKTEIYPVGKSIMQKYLLDFTIKSNQSYNAYIFFMFIFFFLCIFFLSMWAV